MSTKILILRLKDNNRKCDKNKGLPVYFFYAIDIMSDFKFIGNVSGLFPVTCQSNNSTSRANDSILDFASTWLAMFFHHFSSFPFSDDSVVSAFVLSVFLQSLSYFRFSFFSG